MNKLRTYEFPAGRRETAVTVLKFAVCSMVGTLVWLNTLLFLAPTTDPGLIFPSLSELSAVGTEDIPDLLELLWKVSPFLLAGVPAALSYFHLPAETDGILHRFGKGLAMYLPVNITLSAWVIWLDLFQGGMDPSIAPMDVAGLWVLASIFVPGPYIGALIAARWSR